MASRVSKSIMEWLQKGHVRRVDVAATLVTTFALTYCVWDVSAKKKTLAEVKDCKKSSLEEKAERGGILLDELTSKAVVVVSPSGGKAVVIVSPSGGIEMVKDD